MKWGSGEPGLTRLAREISDLMAKLEPEVKASASNTIKHIIISITHLGKLPDEITNKLFDVVLKLVTKAMMPGAKTDKAMRELRDGLSPELAAIIDKESSG